MAALHSPVMAFSPRKRVPLLALACLGALTSFAGAATNSVEQQATSFLEFQSEADGRCQILSEGGKLRVLYNRHASRAINYRLIRVFGDSHQQGRVAGTAPAGGEPVPLGCTQVNGRPQDWQLERATFIP